jgi:AcrR family transcriptional regulator
MPSAGETTRERILAAAKAEFATHGPAGARINRIAETAETSKERLYAYFPSKDDLFAAIVAELIVDVSGETAASGGDMAAYVGVLFDNYVRNPVNARLHDWMSLSPAGTAADRAPMLALEAKIDEIRAGQAAGTIDSTWDPAQLLIMLIEIAKSMAYPNNTARPLLRGKRQVNSRAGRRAAAVEAARRLVEPR